MGTDVAKHTFNRSAAPVLAQCSEIHEQRGGEYGDTWDLKSQRTAFLDLLLREYDVTMTPEQKRLVQLAVLIDIKDTRLLGPFKRDNIVDGINYRAVFTTLFEEYISA